MLCTQTVCPDEISTPSIAIHISKSNISVLCDADIEYNNHKRRTSSLKHNINIKIILLENMNLPILQ